MVERPSFEDYLAQLGHLTTHVDPLLPSAESAALHAAAASLRELAVVDVGTLVEWVRRHPDWAHALGFAVGLSQEKLKNALRHHLDTSGVRTLARSRPAEFVRLLEEEFDLIRSLTAQRSRSYNFGDILVARSGARSTAMRAGASGRRLEDEIEAVAISLGLPYQTRTRFTGRRGRTGSCDLVVPDSRDAVVVVAAKGFDSTGSKLTGAVREIEEMAEVRTPRQFVLAVVDGIGWKSRQADLRRIFQLWETEQIDGLYTLASLDRFRRDLWEAAVVRGVAPPDAGRGAPVSPG